MTFFSVTVGADPMTDQELSRRIKSGINLDIQTRTISANKRESNNKVAEAVIESEKAELQHPIRTRREGITRRWQRSVS